MVLWRSLVFFGSPLHEHAAHLEPGRALLACCFLLRAQMGGEEGAVVATQCADPELDDSSEAAAQVGLVEYLSKAPS